MNNPLLIQPSQVDVAQDLLDFPEFTYAAPEDPRLKRLIIIAIERLTGRRRLKRLYLDHRETARPEDSFWQSAVRILDLEIDFDRSRLFAPPADQPLVVIANHPFGVVDGIVISYLTSLIRPRFKVLTNSVLNQAPEVRPYLLPIDFAETRQALATNLESRRQAIAELREGGAVVIFPGGGVSTALKPFGRATDPDWKPFTAKLIRDSGANVLPLFFEGQNSRLFQVASHLSQTLRLSLFFREVSNKIGSRIVVQIGDVMAARDLAAFSDRHVLMKRLREITYGLENRFG